MDQRALISIGLLAVGGGVCLLVAGGVGARPRRPNPDDAIPPDEGAPLADIATPEESELWALRSCTTCHGFQGRGSALGPDLTKVAPLYLSKYGSRDAAKSALVAYLLDPQNSPKLRTDGRKFANPMPSVLKLFGTREDAETLADLVLRLK